MPRVRAVAFLALLAAPCPAVDPPETPPHQVRLGLVTIDAQARTVSLPVRVNMTQGTLEYALVADHGKTHESLFVTDAHATHLHSGLLLLNAQPAGTNAVRPEGSLALPPQSAVTIEVHWDPKTPRRSERLEELIALVDPRNHSPTNRLRRSPWLFSGSYTTREGYGAHFDGSFIALIRDPIAILNHPLPDAADDEIHAPVPGLPALGTPATLVLTPVPAEPQRSPARDALRIP